MRFALGTKQIAAIVASFVAIYFVAVHHAALQRWFQKTPPAVKQPRGEGWQDGGSGSEDGGAASRTQLFGPGVPSQFVGWVFAGIAVGVLILYFAVRGYIAPIEYKGGLLHPSYRNEEFSPPPSLGSRRATSRSIRRRAGRSRSATI